jgi:hydrogenase maturation protease
MSSPRILIAGVGNIFLGDDAFGVEVARRLTSRPLPQGVRAIDFGIRGLDLAFALLEAYDLAILVDATSRGGSPGTVYVIEPEPEPPGADEVLVEIHGINPENVLRLVRSLGGRPPPLRVVGCEPATLGSDEDPALGLSPAVQPAVDEAVRLIEGLVTEYVDRGAATTGTSSGPVPPNEGQPKGRV